jgi:hypothetical protein
MLDASDTFQRTDNIAKIREGYVAFFGHNSWYRVPPHLEEILRAAQETRREVKFTTDVNCNIHAVELLPAPPADTMRDRLGDMAARLAMRLRR